MKRIPARTAVLVLFLLCIAGGICALRLFRDSAPPSNPYSAASSSGIVDNSDLGESVAAQDKPSETQDNPGETLSVESLVRDIMGASPAHIVNGLIAEPEKCLLRAYPYRFAFLSSEDLLVMVTNGGVYGVRPESGNEVWHRYLESPQGHHGASLEGDKIVGWSDQGVFLLDARSGRETWWKKDKEHGELRYAILSRDGAQLLASFERAYILYTPAEHSQRVLPKIPGDPWPYAWLPDNGGLLFTQRQEKDDKIIRKWFRMDANSGVSTLIRESVSDAKNSFTATFGGGKLAEAAAEEKENTTLRILDALTGEILHEFTGISGSPQYFYWMRDEKRLFTVTSDRKEARVVDSETGKNSITLSREGHRFIAQPPFEEASGNSWIFSQDDENNWYVWPLTSDATPRQILVGANISPGWANFLPHNPGYLLCTHWAGGEFRDFTAYALDGMRKAAQWRAHVEDKSWDKTLVNQEMTHLLRSYPIDPKNHTWPQKMAYQVFVQDRENAIHAGQGDLLDISNDGKYMAVQTDDSIANLCAVETGEVIHQFSTPTPKENYTYMYAAFSNDGTRLVVNTTETFEVMELAGNFPAWSFTMGDRNPFRWSRPILSFDGTRMLCSASKLAGLFDVNTGSQLRVFEEPERFMRAYTQHYGFWQGLAETAKTWAGNVSDAFKESSYVEAAFSEDETRVITWASGQVIRIWDANSGALLHTIHTHLPEQRNFEGNIANRIIVNATGRYAFCYNENAYAPASLWSLADGTLQCRYQWPQREYSWPQAVLSDDGASLYALTNSNLFLWPGAP